MSQERELILPDLGEGLTEATIVKWLVRVGDTVVKNQILVEVETAKAVVELPAQRGGTVLRLNGSAGETIRVGSLIAVIGARGEDSVAAATLICSEDVPATPTEVCAVSEASAHVGIVSGPDLRPTVPGVKAALAVRKLADELSVDLRAISGTGASGQIVESDVRAAARDARSHSRQLTPFRRVVAKNLAAAWAAPQVTAWSSAPAQRLLAVAREEKHPLEALVAHAILPILRELPDFSAHFDGDVLTHIGRDDIGFAVNTPRGLAVAVLRDAASLSRVEFGRRTRILLALAREGRLAPADLSGQTFTVSNIGALGGRYGTSIVPLNTTAVLSIGRAADEVLPVDGTIAIRSMLPLGLSFDHRVIDGAGAQHFLRRACEAIERIDIESACPAGSS